MRVRIVSPRWDDATQRWQQPGEELTIRDAQWETEAACYVHHAVRIEAAAPAAAPVAPAVVDVAPVVEAPAPVDVPAPVSAPADKMARKRSTK